MGKTTTIAKMRPDGSVVEVMTDGSERPISGTPMRPMTPEEVEQAARADPDARPMTAEQLAKARRIPRIKTLRRALGLTQEEFAARYKIPLGHPAGRARRSAGGAFEPAGLCRAGGDALPHRRTEEVVRFEGDYRPRQVDSADVVAPDAGDPRGGWQNLLSNDDVAVAISRRRKAMPYCYRDMEGDLLYFVHRGRGVFATEFGPVSYEPGDWVLLPKATTFRQLPEAGDSLLLVVESPQPIRLCEHEQVGRHTPIDPTMLEVPDIADYGWPRQDEYEVRLKHASGHSSIFYRNDPMKVVGWKGDLFPFKLNVRNILPIMSDRMHVPPSSWVTFEAAGFVVLSIVPQIAVADLEAEELPSYHRNIDMDEVMLSHADEDPGGRRPGNFRHTPQGILHGASEAYRAEFQARRKPGMRRTSTMVGVDTYRPLRPAAEFLRIAG